MDGGAHLQSHASHRLAQLEGAAQCSGGRIEGGQHPVTGALHVVADPSFDLVREVWSCRSRLTPRPIAVGGGLPGRVDQVGEQHRGQDPVHVLGGMQERTCSWVQGSPPRIGWWVLPTRAGR